MAVAVVEVEVVLGWVLSASGMAMDCSSAFHWAAEMPLRRRRLSSSRASSSSWREASDRLFSSSLTRPYKHTHEFTIYYAFLQILEKHYKVGFSFVGSMILLGSEPANRDCWKNKSTKYYEILGVYYIFIQKQFFLY